MRTIDLQELKTMYNAQVEDAKFRMYDMVNAKDYFNTPFDEGLKTAMDWGYNQQKQFDKFDDFIENANKFNEQEETIIRHRTNDKDMLEVAQQDLRKFNGDKRPDNINKRQKEIRKIMRDDAMRVLSITYPMVDLQDSEVLKEIWLDCKIDIRNGINDLMGNINMLREIERYIQLSNNYNLNK